LKFIAALTIEIKSSGANTSILIVGFAPQKLYDVVYRIENQPSRLEIDFFAFHSLNVTSPRIQCSYSMF
jgi:hypothetical protein